MPRSWIRGAVLGVALLTAGCVVATPAPRHVVRTVPPPPPPPAEVVTPAPGPAYVWVPGHWAWRPARGQYVWAPGHWAIPQTPRHVWIPGHWAPYGGGGYTWVEGHWELR